MQFVAICIKQANCCTIVVLLLQQIYPNKMMASCCAFYPIIQPTAYMRTHDFGHCLSLAVVAIE